MVVFLAGTTMVVTVAEEEKQAFEFQADVSKMLTIITSYLYTNRDIFLRELISNASDALDKIRFAYLTEPKEPKNKDGEIPEMDIHISCDKEAGNVHIRDGGVGMTKEELMNHLGSIGTSGTQNFLKGLEEGDVENNPGLIGQFGVGFYSVFLISDNVKVRSKSDDSDTQFIWESTAEGSYFVYPDPDGNTLGRGTEIILKLKENAAEYLDEAKLEKITKTYSEFISFPIYVQKTKTEKVEVPAEPKEDKEPAEGEEGEEADEEEEDEEATFEEVDVKSWDLVNENKPIWTRKPEDVEEEEYKGFYKALTKEPEAPLYFTHFSAEGEVEFKSILYIPGKAPFNLFDHQQMTLMTNIRLYVRRVFITDEFKDLLPRYLNFLKGVVDSDDLPLNVSRELLQESRVLKLIRRKLIRKALQMIKSVADDDLKAEEEAEEAAKAKEEAGAAAEVEDKEREEGEDAGDEDEDTPYEPKYPKFWESFGKNIRLGVIEDTQNRARLTKLLRYPTSSSDGKLISFEEYVDRMPESQSQIYYLVGDSLTKLQESPLLEQAKALDIEVVLMDDAIDEYVVGHIQDFGGKKLANLAKAGVELGESSDKDKKIKEKRNTAWTPFLTHMKEILVDKIEKATISDRVTTTAAVLVSPEYGVTFNMERIMAGQALGDANSKQASRRVMELNPRHAVVDELRRRWKDDPEDQTAKDMVKLLYYQAALNSGAPIDDSVPFATSLGNVVQSGLNLPLDAPLVEEEDYAADDEAVAEDEE